jgi:hypothetical protein
VTAPTRTPWQITLTSAAFAGMAVAFLLGLTEGFVKRAAFYPIPLVVAIVAAGAAAAVLTARLAVVTTSLVLPVIMLLGAAVSPSVLDRLTNPADTLAFVGSYLQLGFEALALVAGVLAVVALNRRQAVPTPNR